VIFMDEATKVGLFCGKASWFNGYKWNLAN